MLPHRLQDNLYNVLEDTFLTQYPQVWIIEYDINIRVRTTELPTQTIYDNYSISDKLRNSNTKIQL